MDASDLAVTVGLLSLSAPDPYEQLLLVTQIVTHPDYEPSSKMNDIALLRVINTKLT